MISSDLKYITFICHEGVAKKSNNHYSSVPKLEAICPILEVSFPNSNKN
jgi:hypothetical protein